MNTGVSEQIGEIALIFMGFRDQLKIYHWQTSSYARHKASDSLGSAINDKMDSFIEIMQGSRGVKLSISVSEPITLVHQTDSTIRELLEEFKNWLLDDLPYYLNDDTDTDLKNLRDDIVGDINQTLYLFTLNK
jgi:hypothetical protein